MTSMGVSPTLAINQMMKQREREGLTTFKLGFGQSPFPVPQILVNRLKDCAHIKDYLPTQGLEELRSAISAYQQSRMDQCINQDNVVVGSGSKELIFLSQMVLDRELILPSPSWVSYGPQAQLLKKNLHWIETGFHKNWKLDADTLEDFLNKNRGKKFYLILNYPNNPAGTTYRQQELIDLSLVARRHDLVIISDEIYSELDFSGQHESISKFYPEGTVLCNGLSKWVGAGGWRLGYMIFPEALSQLRDAVIQAGSETYSCAAAPIQYASIEAFKPHNEIIDYTRRARIIMQYISNYICDHLDASSVSMVRPEGGFYGFLQFNQEFHDYASSTEMCRDILTNTGVALLPGSAFGQQPNELLARMAYVDINSDLIYKKQIITDFEQGTLYLEIPKIREAVSRLNNLNTI